MIGSAVSEISQFARFYVKSHPKKLISTDGSFCICWGPFPHHVGWKIWGDNIWREKRGKKVEMVVADIWNRVVSDSKRLVGRVGKKYCGHLWVRRRVMADENNGRRIRDEPGVGPNGSGPHPWCEKLKCLQRSFFQRYTKSSFCWVCWSEALKGLFKNYTITDGMKEGIGRLHCGEGVNNKQVANLLLKVTFEYKRYYS